MHVNKEHEANLTPITTTFKSEYAITLTEADSTN